MLQSTKLRDKEILRVLIIGCGYWGSNLVRNFVNNSSCKVVGAVDTDEKQRKEIEKRFNLKVYTDFKDFDINEGVDLVVIATRPASHFSIVKFFLEKSINVLVSKPCGLSSSEALQLVDLAESHNVQVFCDLTYHFSPLTIMLEREKRLREIASNANQFVSYRTSLGILQADVDVLADLLMHDLSILSAMNRKRPKRVRCSVIRSSKHGQIESAFVTLHWEDSFTAAIHLSWNSPRKYRVISIVSQNAAIQVEELNNKAPIQIIEFSEESDNYEGLSMTEKRNRNVRFTMGNTFVPSIDSHEPLEFEVRCLVELLLDGKVLLGIPTVHEVVEYWRIIEALRKSNSEGGVSVEVTY